MSNERRISTRVPCRIEAYVMRAGAAGLGGTRIYPVQIEQMSESGVRLHSPVLLPEGEKVTVFVGKRTHPIAFRRDVEVVWSGKNDGDGAWMGGRMLGAGFKRHIGSISRLLLRGN